MLLIARGMVTDGAKPLLEFWAAQDGKLVDLYALSFTIWDVGRADPAQVYPSSGSQAVDVATTYPTAGAGRMSKGRYFATWTATADESTHEIRWSYQFTSTGQVYETLMPFEVVKGPVAEPHMLCGLKELRDEGVGTRFSDARLRIAISLATKRITRITERWFQPEARTLTLDGTGTGWLPFPFPIIAIDSIKISSVGDFESPDITLEPAQFRVYARHISQGQQPAEDRDNPKVEMVSPLSPNWRTVDGPDWQDTCGMRFPEGSQNVQVVGVFGATEYDGSPTGRTPEEISFVCMKLAIGSLPKLASAEASASGGNMTPGGPLKRLKQRDQEAEWATPDPASIRVGDITGDVEVDDILLAWRRPPFVGAV